MLMQGYEDVTEMLITSYLHPNYILITSYLHPNYILLTSCLLPTYFLLTSYSRQDQLDGLFDISTSSLQQRRGTIRGATPASRLPSQPSAPFSAPALPGTGARGRDGRGGRGPQDGGALPMLSPRARTPGATFDGLPDVPPDAALVFEKTFLAGYLKTRPATAADTPPPWRGQTIGPPWPEQPDMHAVTPDELGRGAVASTGKWLAPHAAMGGADL